MPDTCTPFQSTSDACKRLIRYHVFNEQLLSQQDLEKADEFFEATAKHLLDKFRQMLNKYRYLLLMESMVSVIRKMSYPNVVHGAAHPLLRLRYLCFLINQALFFHLED